jgi:hypothetical protein
MFMVVSSHVPGCSLRGETISVPESGRDASKKSQSPKLSLTTVAVDGISLA